MNIPTLVSSPLPTRLHTGNPFIHRGLHLLRAYRQHDCETVRRLALDYLQLAEQHRNCGNYGNAIHQANIVLGLVALENDHVDRAEAYLTAAAATPGSAQLTSFGPNMLLAKKLLLAGRRRTVLTYLDRCGAFWKLSFGRLWRWKLEIRTGRIPNFGHNLTHLLDPKSFG
ncbi:hypothetical protein LEM8419_02971 [Neolewinella maritima]|uniref:Tetratricopeptide repeat protein n=1 Tax=Neolewinella maritima TaxID=1383882 RepID=A0ABN8F564_9BACT|nr:hypothetical protein [Neolewinella maritima]CAH1002056.1 hypothetical protein LEM8419_02971 [Neolewinella maritima]